MHEISKRLHARSKPSFLMKVFVKWVTPFVSTQLKVFGNYIKIRYEKTIGKGKIGGDGNHCIGVLYIYKTSN